MKTTNNKILFGKAISLHVVLLALSLCYFAKRFCLCGRLLAGEAETIAVLTAMIALTSVTIAAGWSAFRAFLRLKAFRWMLSFCVFSVGALPIDVMVVIGAGNMVKQMLCLGDEFFSDDLPVLPDEISIRAFVNDCKWPDNPVIERSEQGMECYSSPRACIAYFNTMESGMCYLRAYEITTGRRLSAKSMTRQTMQSVRWSEDAATAFCHVFKYDIMEGVVEHPYRARIEVWFVPDSGASERKILEKVSVVSGCHHDCRATYSYES